MRIAGSVIAAIVVAVVASERGSLAYQGFSGLQFEAATVKRANGPPRPVGSCRGIIAETGQLQGPSTIPVGRCMFTQIDLKTLIVYAYRVPILTDNVDYELQGGPAWARTDSFNVEAKAENTATVTNVQLAAMLQTLLVDRFKLKIHRETRQVDGYALVVAKGGPKLKDSQGKEFWSLTRRGLAEGSTTNVTAQNASMATLANELSAALGRPVIDKTNVKGTYTYDLNWTRMEDEGSPDVTPATSASAPGPTIFTAIQEQLGLRLVAQKVPHEFIVIDQAVRPE